MQEVACVRRRGQGRYPASKYANTLHPLPKAIYKSTYPTLTRINNQGGTNVLAYSVMAVGAFGYRAAATPTAPPASPPLLSTPTSRPPARAEGDRDCTCASRCVADRAWPLFPICSNMRHARFATHARHRAGLVRRDPLRSWLVPRGNSNARRSYAPARCRRACARDCRATGRSRAQRRSADVSPLSVGGFDAEGRRTASDLFECAAWHIAIVATCRQCKRESVFDPHALWHLYQRKGWRNDLRSVQRRMKCRSCGPQVSDSGPLALGRRFADSTLGEIRAYTISLHGPFTQSERTSSDRFPQIFSIRAYPIGSWDRRSCLSNGKKSLQPR